MLLTGRQLEVLSLSAAYPDLPTGVLAQKLSISSSTFRNLLSGAYLRLGVSTCTAAIVRANELGLLRTPGRPPTWANDRGVYSHLFVFWGKIRTTAYLID